MNEIIIATRNQGKAREFKDFFAPYHITVKSLMDLEDLPDIAETGKTFEENAALKAEQIATLVNLPVLADDSGLIVDALDGRPGVYSARYAGEKKDDQANIDKVLTEMRNVPKESRTARFICVLAGAVPGRETIFCKGYCEGEIGFVQKGENGFGYDPIFIPEDYDETMAELSSDEKNNISHRKHAMQQLKQHLHIFYNQGGVK